MPKFSLFTPLGHLKFSRAPAYGEQFFEAGKASLGKAFRVERGKRTFTWLYAWSMTLASARILLERAGEQWDPTRTYEFLPVQEDERGSPPHAGWSIQDRRAQLARMRKLILSVSRVAVENALREVLGDRFLAYIPTPKSAIVNWPENLGDSPMVLARADLPRRVAKLASNIASTGTVTVNYGELAAGIAWQLQKGDVVVVEPENDARSERVTILSTSDGDGAGPYTIRFTATKPHSVGVAIVKQPYPMWTGSKRHSLVVLTDAAAQDPEARRLVQWALERMCRATSTWDVAGANAGDLTAGPWKVAEAKLGVTPIGFIAL